MRELSALEANMVENYETLQGRNGESRHSRGRTYNGLLEIDGLLEKIADSTIQIVRHSNAFLSSLHESFDYADKTWAHWLLSTQRRETEFKQSSSEGFDASLPEQDLSRRAFMKSEKAGE